MCEIRYKMKINRFRVYIVFISGRFPEFGKYPMRTVTKGGKYTMRSVTKGWKI